MASRDFHALALRFIVLMIIGDRLRATRKEKKLAQGDIEKRTGLLRCYSSSYSNKGKQTFRAARCSLSLLMWLAHREIDK